MCVTNNKSEMKQKKNKKKKNKRSRNIDAENNNNKISFTLNGWHLLWMKDFELKTRIQK